MPEAYGLYVVMTDPVVGYERCAEAAVAEGVRYVQLRMKNATRAEVIETARAVRAVTADSGTRFIVNDDVSVAMEVDADGVHLGQNDMPLGEARALWDTPGKIFGFSTHNEEQQREAYERMPDYIGIGPIHVTPTKVIPDPVIGYERMARMIHTCPLEYVCIGGITLDNLHNLLERGAVNICSVRPIMQSENPQTVIRAFMDRCRAAAAES